MLNDSYRKGQDAALARFKLGNMQQGAAGYNPMLSGQAATGTQPHPGGSMHPPALAGAPVAAGAAKAHALG